MRVRLEQRIASSARVVAPALAARVAAYASNREQPIMLNALEMSVPIVVRVTHAGSPAEGTGLAISAEHNAALFPVFEGVVRAEPIDALSAHLVLDGTYSVPLGLLGAAADRTVLADVARSSLQRFLERMKDEVSMDVLRADTAP